MFNAVRICPPVHANLPHWPLKGYVYREVFQCGSDKRPRASWEDPNLGPGPDPDPDTYLDVLRPPKKQTWSRLTSRQRNVQVIAYT